MTIGGFTARAFLLALAVVAVWGTNFVVIRIGLDALPPLLFAALRFAVVVVPLIFVVRRPAVSWRDLALYGLFIGVGQFGLLFIAIDGLIAPGLAKLQPYLFGLSMYFFCLVMMGAGTLGVSRRHWDMAFRGAALAYEWPGAAYLMLGLVGIAGISAIVGGGIYIYITVGSILWGKRLDTGAVSARFTPIPPTAPTIVAQSYGSAGFAAPGTFALAMVFLVSFVLYYFINWKYLSQVWGLS